MSFQGVIDKMPNYISGAALSNISVPYYFICLLHLCNEQHLRLEKTESGDVSIVRH